jgi:hypothetical protein
MNDRVFHIGLLCAVMSISSACFAPSATADQAAPDLSAPTTQPASSFAHSPTDLLLHPETVLTAGARAAQSPALAVSVDGKPLSYDQPKILFHQSRDGAECVAAVWNGPDGTPSHRREVLLVGGDYAIVVDHLYGTGAHDISRTSPEQWQLIDSNPVRTDDAIGETKSTVNVDDAPASQISGPASQNRAAASQSGAAAMANGALTLQNGASGVPNGLPAVRNIVVSRKSLPCFVAATIVRKPVANVPKLSIVAVKAHNPLVMKCNVIFPGGRVDHVGIAWESRLLHLGDPEQSLHGWAACLRDEPTGQTVIELK